MNTRAEETKRKVWQGDVIDPQGKEIGFMRVITHVYAGRQDVYVEVCEKDTLGGDRWNLVDMEDSPDLWTRAVFHALNAYSPRMT